MNTLRFARGAVVALAMAGLAACASTPKSTGGSAPAPSYDDQPSRPAQSGPVSQAPTGPIPGSIQDFVINIGDRVYFDFDEFVVRADARPILDGQAAWLNRYRTVRVRIEGNADERGTREYNFALGARRAEAIRTYLVGRGVDPSRIETISYGKERPIDPGSNEDAWAKNRNGHTQITSGAR